MLRSAAAIRTNLSSRLYRPPSLLGIRSPLVHIAPQCRSTRERLHLLCFCSSQYLVAACLGLVEQGNVDGTLAEYIMRRVVGLRGVQRLMRFFERGDGW